VDAVIVRVEQNANRTARILVGIRMLGGTDISDSSSYSGCACSLQKAATAMLDVHRHLPRPDILPKGHGSVAVDNGCEPRPYHQEKGRESVSGRRKRSESL
jgi:hypothetical protein